MRTAGVVALVVAAALLAVPAGAPAQAEAVDHPVSSPVAQQEDGVESSPRADRDAARAAIRYWTPQRMAQARPVVEPPRGRRGSGLVPAAAAASAAAVAAAPRDEGVKVPRTTGKLFFRTRNGRGAVCSAAVIRAKRHNQVITAGHCVHNGGGGRWFRDWVFVPRYHKGKRPFGAWAAKRAHAPRKWTQRSRFTHDWAIIEFRKRKGRTLQQRVGGNRVRVGAGVKHRGVRVWGWPAEAPYNGRTGQLCQGKSTRWSRSKHAKIRCNLTGGASGGPWLLKKNRHKNKGIIFAVTSRRTVTGPAYVVARPLPKAFAKLKRRVNR